MVKAAEEKMRPVADGALDLKWRVSNRRCVAAAAVCEEAVFPNCFRGT